MEHPATKLPGVTLKPFFTMIDAAKLESIEHRAIAAGIAPPGWHPILQLSFRAEWRQPRSRPRFQHGRVRTRLCRRQAGSAAGRERCRRSPGANQGYLLLPPPASMRILPGLKLIGSGIGFVDLEQGWIPRPRGPPHIHPGYRARIGSSGPDVGQSRHVRVGDRRGVDNDKGIVGIVPHTSVRVVSQWFEPAGQEPFFGTAIALALAMAEMQKGDILLIETTAPPVSKFGWVPAEVDPLVFDLIKTATGRRFSFAADGAWRSDQPRRAGGASPSSFWRMKDSPSPTIFKSGRFPRGRHVIRIFEPAQRAAHRLVSMFGDDVCPVRAAEGLRKVTVCHRAVRRPRRLSA